MVLMSAATLLSMLTIGWLGTSSAFAGSYSSPYFTCAPATWCLVPGANGSGTAPYEKYYYVDAHSPATFSVSAYAGLYNSTYSFFAWALGNTCPFCAVENDVIWYDGYPVDDGYLVVYNVDSSHSRQFFVTGYW